MDKSDVKEIFKELELESVEAKPTFSFRIDKKELDKFKKKCSAKGYAAGLVLEKLVKNFNNID